MYLSTLMAQIRQMQQAFNTKRKHMKSYLLYAICAIIIVKATGCTVVPMNPRTYKVIQYPDKDLMCVCSESKDDNLEDLEE